MSDVVVKPDMPAAPPTPAIVPIPTPPATTVQPPAAAPPDSEIKRVPMSRLTGIEIKNYFAYRGTFRLDLPKGENLLVYGENGAGKSSLFHALRVFLEAPDFRVPAPTESNPKATRAVVITDHRHRFTTGEPTVKLEFGQRVFEWTEEQNDTGHEIARLLNQGKGFLDYKALLEVHYVRSADKPTIDLFPLLIRRLLPYYTYSHQGTSRTFQSSWEWLNTDVKSTWLYRRRRNRPEEDFRAALKEFNEALERAAHDLGARASAMLATFGDDYRVDFRFTKGEFKTGPKRIEGPTVLAVPAFRKLQCHDYHTFLNEARLSALAICLFFAALKESPATGLRLLMLDDVLIGLDMANRVKVIDLLRELVSDKSREWQIVILTYSKAWFERLKEHLASPAWAHPWKSVVLWEDWRTEDNSPHTVIKDNSPHIVADGSGTLIEMAERHLLHKDYKAAAVYARSALEALCHHTCAKASLPVLHVAGPKERKVEHYIEVLENRLGQLKQQAERQSAAKLIARLREGQAFVLNRNAHFDVEDEDTLSGEVKAAIQTVRDLANFFEKLSWKKGNFDDGLALPPTERMTIELAEARKLARFGPKEEGVKDLAVAHHLAWEVFGRREKVVLPIGTPLNAKTIWTAAIGQTKLDAALDARLKAARPYLFGCVKSKDFDPTKFQEAAKLLEELCGSQTAPPAAPAIASPLPPAPGP